MPVILPYLITDDIAHLYKLGFDGLGIYSEPGNWLTYELTHLAEKRRCLNLLLKHGFEGTLLINSFTLCRLLDVSSSIQAKSDLAYTYEMYRKQW